MFSLPFGDEEILKEYAVSLAEEPGPGPKREGRETDVR
jgi:hypothetical protein